MGIQLQQGFINKLQLHTQRWEEGEIPSLQDALATKHWQNRLRKMEELCFFTDICIKLSTSCSFLLRALKYFLMEGKASWLIKNQKCIGWNWGCYWTRIVTGVDCFPSTFPLKKRTFCFDKSDPGGLWFLKKSLFWGEKNEKGGEAGRGLMTLVFTHFSWFSIENL